MYPESAAAFLAPYLCHPAAGLILQLAAGGLVVLAAINFFQAVTLLLLAGGSAEVIRQARTQALYHGLPQIIGAFLLAAVSSGICA